MNKKSPQTRLAELAAQLARATVQREDEVFERYAVKGLVEDLKHVRWWDISIGPRDFLDAAGSVFEELELQGQDHGFENVAEVMRFAIDQHLYSGSAEWWSQPEVAGPKLAELLRTAFLQYRFELPLVGDDGWLRSSFGLNWSIGGPHGISIASTKPGKGSSGALLRGAVKAATLDGALIKIERLTYEVIGAMRAVQLMQLVDPGVSHSDAVATVHLNCGDRIVDEAQPLAANFTFLLRATRLRVPQDLSELHQRHVGKGELDLGLKNHLRRVEAVLAGGSERADFLRSACRLAINAEIAQEFGVAITLAFRCLEGLLLSGTTKEDVTARLSEAMAYSLGRSFGERESIKKRVKAVYDLRSSFVHRGKVREQHGSRAEALDLMYRVLSREIDFLPRTTLPAEEASPEAG